MTWSEKHSHVVPGAKRTTCCGAVALIRHVGLRAVVQPEHQVIVVAAHALGHAQRRQQCRGARPRAPDVRQQRRGHRREILAHPPHAVFGRIDIAEYAQDAFAVIGTRWKSVDVQARIVFAPGYGAADRRLGTETRSRTTHIWRITRETAQRPARPQTRRTGRSSLDSAASSSGGAAGAFELASRRS